MATTKINYNQIKGGCLNLLDFGADPTGAIDASSALQAALIAITAAYPETPALYIPAGYYKVNTPCVIGTEPTKQAHSNLTIFGDGMGSILYSTVAVAGLITVQGPDPVGGTRFDGRVHFHDLCFQGPTAAVGGNALKFYGCQGIRLDHLYIEYWDTGILSEIVDLFEVGSCVIRFNNYGFLSDDSASNDAIIAAGCLNSLSFHDNYVLTNAQVGLWYGGGNMPVIRDNNFVSNGYSIRLSVSGATSTVTSNPLVEGNYFEDDSIYNIELGQGSGIVRSGTVRNNLMLVKDTHESIHAGNVANDASAYGSRVKVYDNYMTVIGGAGTLVPIGYNGNTPTDIALGRPIDYEIQNSNLYTQGSFINWSLINTCPTPGNKDLFTFTGDATTYGLSGILTIRASSVGVATEKVYALSLMAGAATQATVTATTTTNYNGGACDFHLRFTYASTTAITPNVVNDSGVGSVQFEFTFFVTSIVNGTIVLNVL